jgi:hypothetical protein
MKKYKLIKEYPGSPKLGEIALPYTDSKNKVVHYIVEHPSKDCDYLAISKKHIEDNSEYWEEVVNVWYVVLLKDGAFRNAWEVIKVNEDPSGLEHKKYFKTEKEAEEFIFYNKPCLSYSDVSKSIHVGFSTERILMGIHKTLKEKL